MIVRVAEDRDLVLAKQIHEKYYKDEFVFPSFASDFHTVYSIVDNFGNPILVGGVKPIAEVIIVTDKSRHIKDKIAALKHMLTASVSTAEKFNYSQIHCAIQDQAYERHLKRIGFRPVKGSFLVLDI